MDPPLIAIILGTTREGRRGDRVAAWFEAIARGRDDLRTETHDLLAWNLPWYRGPVPPPRGGRDDDPAARRWSAAIARADGFVLVCPEYNHGYPAPLKNALDHLYDEWGHKPVSFVTYGGSGGGIRAAEQLVGVAVELRMAPLREQVHIPLIGRVLGRDGGGEIDAGHAERARRLLDELAWWARALREARAGGVPGA